MCSVGIRGREALHIISNLLIPAKKTSATHQHMNIRGVDMISIFASLLSSKRPSRSADERVEARATSCPQDGKLPLKAVKLQLANGM